MSEAIPSVDESNHEEQPGADTAADIGTLALLDAVEAKRPIGQAEESTPLRMRSAKNTIIY